MPGVVFRAGPDGTFDWIQVFARNRAELRRLAPRAVRALGPDGILWISFPKGTSTLQTDLTRDNGWEPLRRFDLKCGDARFRQRGLVSLRRAPVQGRRSAALVPMNVLMRWHTFAELSGSEVYEILSLRQRVFIVEQCCAYNDADGVDRISFHLCGRTGAGELAAYLRLIPPGGRCCPRTRAGDDGPGNPALRGWKASC